MGEETRCPIVSKGVKSKDNFTAMGDTERIVGRYIEIEYPTTGPALVGSRSALSRDTPKVAKGVRTPRSRAAADVERAARQVPAPLFVSGPVNQSSLRLALMTQAYSLSLLRLTRP